MSRAASSRLATNPRLTSTRSSRSRSGRNFWLIGCDGSLIATDTGNVKARASIRPLLRALRLILTGRKRLNPLLAVLLLHQDFNLPLASSSIFRQVLDNRIPPRKSSASHREEDRPFKFGNNRFNRAIAYSNFTAATTTPLLIHQTEHYCLPHR
jgi:hypothetical protein